MSKTFVYRDEPGLTGILLHTQSQCTSEAIMQGHFTLIKGRWMPCLLNGSVYLFPPPRNVSSFSEILRLRSWYFHLDSREATAAGSDRARVSPVFDPDVTSVMDESRPASGKTQLFQLPIIWQPFSAALYVGVPGSRRQKREDTRKKWDMCFLAFTTCPSTGRDFPLPLSFLKLSYTRRRSWMGNVWLSWQRISKME